MQVSSETFQEVAQYLDRHEESVRIKKLIFCICKKYWENDSNILNSVPFEDLLQELIQQKNSNDQLTFSIYKLVKTLNRPQVYASVAKVIIEQVGKLYQSSTSYNTELLGVSVSPITITNPTPDLGEQVEQIVNYLSKHPELPRIKKLLFAACKNKWENSLVSIDSYGIGNLVQELKQIYPDKNSLKISLERIAENINKKDLYLALASIIYSQMVVLYSTQVIRVDNALENTESPEVEIAEPSRVPFDTSIVALDESPVMTSMEVSGLTSVQPTVKEYDPFEIRMEILRYTNPLRAKILLFSVLFHPWDRSGQDWPILRSYTLDDLLEQLIQSGKSIKDIETQLYRVSKTQTDVEANLHSSSVLVQALQRVL
jgi:hypothetical protein